MRSGRSLWYGLEHLVMVIVVEVAEVIVVAYVIVVVAVMVLVGMMVMVMEVV